MKTRGVIGKRIVAVQQERDGIRGMRVTALVLEDGTKLLLSAYETEDRPAVTVDVIGPRGPRKRAEVAVTPSPEPMRVKELSLQPGDRVQQLSFNNGVWQRGSIGTVGEPMAWGARSALRWRADTGYSGVLYEDSPVELIARAGEQEGGEG